MTPAPQPSCHRSTSAHIESLMLVFDPLFYDPTVLNRLNPRLAYPRTPVSKAVAGMNSYDTRYLNSILSRLSNCYSAKSAQLIYIYKWLLLMFMHIPMQCITDG